MQWSDRSEKLTGLTGRDVVCVCSGFCSTCPNHRRKIQDPPTGPLLTPSTSDCIPRQTDVRLARSGPRQPRGLCTSILQPGTLWSISSVPAKPSHFLLTGLCKKEMFSICAIMTKRHRRACPSCIVGSQLFPSSLFLVHFFARSAERSQPRDQKKSVYFAWEQRKKALKFSSARVAGAVSSIFSSRSLSLDLSFFWSSS
ncbi:hypothetical protein BCV70DRAFT_25780 [Testicularia cyperi]|uniref:Uncharacterized protein n=1 Tax=Testicularia cyperi TaxID=1882483 RepID=A0A317XLJ2_9BASI|nr:hypothetical protein BCV70DRAFT_25780 [Testicularia cyperi]